MQTCRKKNKKNKVFSWILLCVYKFFFSHFTGCFLFCHRRPQEDGKFFLFLKISSFYKISSCSQGKINYILLPGAICIKLKWNFHVSCYFLLRVHLEFLKKTGKKKKFSLRNENVQQCCSMKNEGLPRSSFIKWNNKKNFFLSASFH